jgi:drug/metabolite transporter (DMT)-like permease
MSAVAAEVARPARTEGAGALLVLLSAVVWSVGGTIALYLEGVDSWTTVFWRSAFAAAFLLGFMVWRDGWRGTGELFRGMGWAGLGVACCFAVAASCFVVAVGLTTVASIVLIQAGVPLLAAGIAYLVFGEKVGVVTAVAIAAVIVGVAVMVSNSFGGGGSALGNGLALLIALAFSVATVLTRRFSHVRMTPANCLGMMIAAAFAATQAPTLLVSGTDFGLLAVFGALNLGLGLALFASGARLVPAALAALLGTMETVLSPVWVWLVHGQVPDGRTLLGGGIVFAALIAHLALELTRQGRRGAPARKPGVIGMPLP